MKFNKVQNPKNYISSLLLHSTGFLSGDFISKAVYILFLPLITVLLDPGDFGILSIYLTLLNIISIFFRLGIQGSINRYYYDCQDRYRLFLGTNIISLTSFSIVIIILVHLFAKDNLSTTLHIPEAVISFALLNALLLLLFNIYTAHLQATRQSKRYARIDIFFKLTSVVLSVFLMYYLAKDKYMAKVYADLVILLITMGIIFKSFASYPVFRFSRKELLYALSFGLPLIPHTLSAQLLHMFDRIIINQIVGETETGLYSLAYQIGIILQIIILGMNRSWITFFYENLGERNFTLIKNTFRSYQKIIAIIAIGMVLFAGDLVFLIVNERYHESIGIISPIVVGYLFLFYYTIYSNYLFYLKKTILISVNTVIATIFNIVANYYFIGRYGYAAAAYTTLGSFMLLFVLNYLTAKINFKKNIINLKQILPSILLIFLFVAVSEIIGEIENILLRLLLKLVVFLSIAIIFFYRTIRQKVTVH